jgi:hypothetical protein
MPKSSKKLLISLDDIYQKMLDELAEHYACDTKTHVIRLAITFAHRGMSAPLSPALAPSAPLDTRVSSAPQAKTENRGRRALSYEEKLQKKQKREAEERAYQMSQCELYGGSVSENTCIIPRYQVTTGGGLVRLEQGVPLPFCERADFKEWAITSRYSSVAEAERAYKSEAKKRAKSDAERLKRAEDVARAFAELELKRKRIAIENGWRYVTAEDGTVTAERVDSQESTESNENAEGEN